MTSLGEAQLVLILLLIEWEIAAQVALLNQSVNYGHSYAKPKQMWFAFNTQEKIVIYNVCASFGTLDNYAEPQLECCSLILS